MANDGLSALEEVLSNEQLDQLAEMILRRLAHGWGSLEIVFYDHRIQEYRETWSTLGRRSRKAEDDSVS